MARPGVSGGPVGVGSWVGLALGRGADVSTTASGPRVSGLPVPVGEGLDVQPPPTNAATSTREKEGSHRRIGVPILGVHRFRE